MAAQEPPIPTDGAAPVLAALVARMRDAGIGPGVEELADALWLARWLPAPVSSAAGETSGAGGGAVAVPPGGHQHAASPPPGPSRPPAGQEEASPPDGAWLFAPGGDGPANGEGGTGDGPAPVRVPAAPSLPEPLALQRGLRPLQRYRAPVRPVPRTLDERATAERAAESGLVLPVLRTDRRREARLLLLMDVSTSTVVWQQALDELRQVCARAGAFRELQVQYLHEGPGGRPGCSSSPETGGPLHAPEQLSDPTGRRVTLVLSDCAGPMWRSGRVQRLLHRWAATAPVAVAQPLPQRMWVRTHLPARRGMLHRREGPAGALEFHPDRGAAERGALPVPVLALRRPSVEGWARLVSGATGQSLAAAAGWVRADHPASAAPVRAAEDVGGAERVRAFWRPASPEARRLAVYLSAVPLQLPVMQLVQHAMLAGSGPDVLSEVLLGGLLRREPDTDDPQAVRYRFLPGVATELRARLTVEDVQLLFKHCSEYVERRFGRSVRNFPALAGAFLRGAVSPGERLVPVTGPAAAHATGPGAAEPPGLRAFAEVSADVLRELGARMPRTATVLGFGAEELLERGREAYARFRTEGLTRELDAAVGSLRQALTVARPGERRVRVAESLAECLLDRWRVGADGDDLREAWEAVADPRGLTGHGRFVRGVICSDQAYAVHDEGIGFPGVPADLRDWAADAAAHSEHDPAEFARAVLLYLADSDFAAVLGAESESADRRRAAGLVLLNLRGVIALVGADRHGADGPYPAGDSPEEWYVTHLYRALDAATTTAELPGSDQTRAERGRLWLELARQFAGQGPVASSADEADRARDAAASATEDLMAVLSRENTLPDTERCRLWLDVASAVSLAEAGTGTGTGDGDDGGHALLTHALERAQEAAGDDGELRVECRTRAASAHWESYERTGDPASLDLAVGAWEAVVRLLHEDDPRLPAVLTDCGAALRERAGHHDSPQDTHRAVDMLRRAVDETPPDDPALPHRRSRLADAHVGRFHREHVLSDLYEADWLLGEAVRGSEEPRFQALYLMRRGIVALHLHTRLGTPDHADKAVEHYTQGAEHAREAGPEGPAVLALALRGRAHARERLGRARTALADYREALRLTTDPELAELLRSDIARLTSGTADA
ncbi:SAV_2336 N-terminal domain-related protein [Streptomyces sp. NPDC017260]|uniref:SAV_2336 N-terminal domain-related protein n=1 Tax=unclassified Streptomyces TaxID=2593676 RepID=UPI0037B16A10